MSEHTMTERRWRPTLEELERLIYLHLISCEPRTGKAGAHDAAKAIYANLYPSGAYGEQVRKP